jgi:uncharacterized protein YpiB (UPF0302 family)
VTNHWGGRELSTVTVSEKKEFIHWFLGHHELRKREVAWLLSYLSSKEELLAKVHFVEHVSLLPKSIIISTKCSDMPPFQFSRKKRVGTDVEAVFYDLQLFPNEDIYIGLYFQDRTSCPKFAAVLEGNPMERQDLVQDQLLSLFAEMLLDQAVRQFQKKQLYAKIDESLENQDKDTFLKLSQELRKLLEESK